MNPTPIRAAPLVAAAEEYRRAVAAEARAKSRADRAKQETRAKRRALAEAIVAAGDAGLSTDDIRQATGYTRQRVQQIRQAAGKSEEGK